MKNALFEELEQENGWNAGVQIARRHRRRHRGGEWRCNIENYRSGRTKRKDLPALYFFLAPPGRTGRRIEENSDE